jgi:glycosyltransferase involved in cell wall biosynthesis
VTPACSIVVPCFNEAENLPALLAAFHALRRPDSDWELVLVDNGSTDASAEILANCSEPWLLVVTVPRPNIGYGHGIVTGLRAARGALLGWTHADGQTPPADVLRAFELLKNAADPARTLVKGRRRNRPVRDAAFTAGMQLAGLVLLRRSIPDANGQPKVFHRDLLEKMVDPPTDLSLDLYALWLAQSLGWQRLELDVRFGDRLHGESRWAFSWRSKARHIGRTLRFMRRLGRAGR